jgi:putative ABC transport system substrate-binding protein
MMQRRAFISLIGAVAAATALPRPARAQKKGERIRRIGAIIGGGNERDPQTSPWNAALRRGLQDLGWVEGRNLRLDLRWPAGDLARVQAAAQELVALKPDVLFAGSTPSVSALLRETRTIPIVFANLSDPVGSGLVASLARPGGNATGFAAFEPSLGGKWLEILKQLVPATKRTMLLFNPDTAPFAPLYVSALEAAAPTFGVRLIAAPVRTVDDITQAMTAESQQPGGSMIVLPDSYTNANRAPIIALAARLRLPAVYFIRVHAVDGGLVSYGPETSDLYRRAASYIDQILRGHKPADMPIQHPVKYELILNLKTAKELGIDVPSSFQQLADEVIE